MSYWFSSCFDATPTEVFSWPFAFNTRSLPPFYKSLLIAWRELDGSFSVPCDCLVFGASTPHFPCPASSMSTKFCYVYLLSEDMVDPHCVEKFSGTFGNLHWSTRSLTFFDLDRQVIDLNWKIAHGVLYTAERLSSFGLNSGPHACAKGARMRSPYLRNYGNP